MIRSAGNVRHVSVGEAVDVLGAPADYPPAGPHQGSLLANVPAVDALLLGDTMTTERS
jgi:hypothetical protein